MEARCELLDIFRWLRGINDEKLAYNECKGEWQC